MTEEETIYEAVEVASNTGKIKRGVNETTKAIEREKACFVVIAKDVSPEAIIMHLPVLCNEKKIPYVYVPSRKELGEASGIKVSVSALAIVEEGDAKKLLEKMKKTHVIEEKPGEAEEAQPKKEKPLEAPVKEEKPAEKPLPEKEEKRPEKGVKEKPKKKPKKKKGVK